MRSTEIFDPHTNGFSAGPECNFDRFKLTHSIITLKTGTLLVAGGDQPGGCGNDAQCTAKAWVYVP